MIKYFIVFLIVLSICAGCTRGPDEKTLVLEIQEKLNKQFKMGLFEIVSIKREGSGYLAASEAGAKRLIVYYNGTIRLLGDYNFTDWQGLSPGTLAHILGATEKGISGIKQQNRKGELIKVFGTATYEQSGNTWKPVEVVRAGVAQAPSLENSAPPTKSKQLIDKLASMVDLPPPGVDPKQDEVISEELDRAVKAISVRLERRKRKYIFAGGPSGGEYSRIIDAITTLIAKSRPDLKIGSLDTQGSVENAWLLNLGQADFALIQSNIAAMAVSGEGPFAGGEPITKLRAMGSLFPEPVHVVVSAQSVIRSISDLRGKVVDVGMLKSGTYYDASTVLRSHGLTIKDLKEARTKGHEDAIKRLRAGSLDAFFVTMGSPAKDLQQLATRARIRLISLDNRAIERIVSESPGMIRFVLPPNTYPGQTDEVSTVAATSLFVTTIDTPQEEALGLLKLVFEKTEAMVSYSSQASKISKENGLRGITVPMHAAATRYFAGEKKGSANPNNKSK